MHQMLPEEVDINMVARVIAGGDVGDLTDPTIRQYLSREVGRLQEEHPEIDWSNKRDISKLAGQIGSIVKVLTNTCLCLFVMMVLVSVSPLGSL